MIQGAEQASRQERRPPFWVPWCLVSHLSLVSWVLLLSLLPFLFLSQRPLTLLAHLAFTLLASRFLQSGLSPSFIPCHHLLSPSSLASPHPAQPQPQDSDTDSSAARRPFLPLRHEPGSLSLRRSHFHLCHLQTVSHAGASPTRRQGDEPAIASQLQHAHQSQKRSGKYLLVRATSNKCPTRVADCRPHPWLTV